MTHAPFSIADPRKQIPFSLDFELAASMELSQPLWQSDGRFHAFYAGALLPKAVRPLDELLRALRATKEKDPAMVGRFQLHFVGTGSHPSDPNGHQVLPRARELGVEDLVSEHPHRMPYLQVLAHLRHCDGVLVLGSTEAHYSPSKTFQAIQSDKPILAILHEQSTAVDYLREVGGAEVITTDDDGVVNCSQLTRSLYSWIFGDVSVPAGRSSSIPDEQTGRIEVDPEIRARG